MIDPTDVVRLQAEFAWKVKPKLPAQFKAAETGGVPFAVVLGDEELAQGKVKIKEMGLPEGHPEKEGVLVEKANLVQEVRQRLEKLGASSQGDAVANGTANLKLDEVADAPK